jgi:hypothetical protein
MSFSRFTRILPTLLGLAACAPDPIETDGATAPPDSAVQSSAFLYSPASNGDGDPREGVSTIAKSASFRVAYRPATRLPDDPRPPLDLSTLRIETTSSDAIALAGDGSAVALRPGPAGFVALAGKNDLLDFVAFEIREVAAIEIETATRVLEPTRETNLRAALIDVFGAKLSGSLPITWQTDDPDIVALYATNDAPGSLVRAVAKAVGHATIVAHLDWRVATIDIEVKP